MNTSKNEHSGPETMSASQTTIVDSVAKPEGGVTAWCTVAGGYVIIYAYYKQFRVADALL